MTPVGPEYRYVEKPSMELLAELGWSTLDAYNEELGETGTLGRDSHRDVVLTHRLRSVMRALNPEYVPQDVIEEAIEALTKDRSAMDPVRANREVRDLVRDGYQAEWVDAHGEKQIETLRFIDFACPIENDLLAARQVLSLIHI